MFGSWTDFCKKLGKNFVGVDPNMNAGQQKKSHGQVGGIGEWVLFGNILQSNFRLIGNSLLYLVPVISLNF